MKVEDYKYFIDKYPIDYADKYYICWSATNDTFTKIEHLEHKPRKWEWALKKQLIKY